MVFDCFFFFFFFFFLTNRIACVVNDVAALNIDSALVKNMGGVAGAVGGEGGEGGVGEGSIKEQSEELVELQNGCVCCTLRADLVKSVAEMAKQGMFDHVVIECTGLLFFFCFFFWV